MDSDKIKSAMFREDGEILRLILAILIVVAVGLIFVQMSWIVTAGLIVLGFIYIKLQQAQLIGNALEVNKFQFAEIWEIFENYKNKLGLKRVSLYIKQDPQPNAFTIGFPRASIILNSALVESFSKEELSFVIGHELGHVKAGHSAILTFISPLGNNIPAATSIFSFWQRKAEYSCDKCGLILTKSVEPAVKGLLKLSVGLTLAKKINLQNYKEQLISSDNGVVRASEFLFDHPLTTNRINNMISFWKENFITRS